MKRNLFDELSGGIEALQQEREGLRTLPTTQVRARPAIRLTAAEVKAVRENLNLSQPVFACTLRTNTRTLQNWEQGRARPNAQASLLIRMMGQFPDMARRLDSL
jgi:putative transcriptional regulator